MASDKPNASSEPVANVYDPKQRVVDAAVKYVDAQAEQTFATMAEREEHGLPNMARLREAQAAVYRCAAEVCDAVYALKASEAEAHVAEDKG